MAKPYSMDLRERVIARCDAGERPEDVGPAFEVSARTVYDWLALRRETGSAAPRSGKRGRKWKLAGHEETFRALVREHADATLVELRDLLCDRLPIEICASTVWAAGEKLQISFKKK